MSLVGKVYGKIQIERVGKITDGMIDDEQGGLGLAENVWDKCLL